MTVSARRRWGLQTVLAGGLLSLALAIAGALAWQALREFDRMADDAARAVLGQQAREAARHVSALSERAAPADAAARQDLAAAFARIAATPRGALALVDPAGRLAAWGGGAQARRDRPRGIEVQARRGERHRGDADAAEQKLR